jgi:polysaccharide export outer membrane protein
MKKHNPLSFGSLSTAILLIFLAASTGIAQDISNGTYVVGPGDVLDIQVWDHDDLNRTVEISQEGIFTFPFVGQVEASSLSIFQIERLLTQKLSDGYLVAPQVSITVTEYRNQTVFLLGQVARPGSYVLKHRNHLLELISKAGGFTERSGTTCIIVRPEAGVNKNEPTSIQAAKKSEIIKVNLDNLLSGAADTPPFYVMPGDSIYIGESEKIFVIGEVRRPGQFSWEKGLTVRQAVSMAGGGTPRASINRVRIIRNDNGEEKTVKPNLGDPVLPNDIIKVPESYF